MKKSQSFQSNNPSQRVHFLESADLVAKASELWSALRQQTGGLTAVLLTSRPVPETPWDGLSSRRVLGNLHVSIIELLPTACPLSPALTLLCRQEALSCSGVQPTFLLSIFRDSSAASGRCTPAARSPEPSLCRCPASTHNSGGIQSPGTQGGEI